MPTASPHGLSLLFATALAAQAPEVAPIPWRPDLMQARAEAAAKRLPLFVVFRCER